MFQRIRASREAEGEGGFTLIELLVVIIILGILAAVVVFAVGGVGDKGQTASCKIDTRTLRTAEEAYAAQPVANGGGGGLYVAQGTSDAANDLVPNFLSEPPKYHTVTLTGTPVGTSFTVDPVAGQGCTAATG
jgi:prepilin-type N-terminal cleavage/methylation domain-containing protein